MSTISAMLLVATTHLVYDVGKAIKPDLSDDTLKKVLPIAICVLGAIVVYTALKVTDPGGCTVFYLLSVRIVVYLPDDRDSLVEEGFHMGRYGGDCTGRGLLPDHVRHRTYGTGRRSGLCEHGGFSGCRGSSLSDYPG